MRLFSSKRQLRNFTIGISALALYLVFLAFLLIYVHDKSDASSPSGSLPKSQGTWVRRTYYPSTHHPSYFSSSTRYSMPKANPSPRIIPSRITVPRISPSRVTIPRG